MERRARTHPLIMDRPLALHHLTMRESPIEELIATAAETGCSDVCLFTHAPRVPVPGATFTHFPTVDRSNLAGVKAALAEHRIGVTNIEFFPVTEDLDMADYAESFAIGAELGALRAVTHIHDPDFTRAVETLGKLCDFAATFNLKLGLEFMGLTPACNSIGLARRFVEGVGRGNIGIALDALHLVRTGGTAEDILAIPADLFCYAQICDGRGNEARADYRPEGQDRLPPGQGEWPLRSIFSALPTEVPIDIEVPSTTQAAQGIPARSRAKAAVARTRELLLSIGGFSDSA